MWLPGLNHVPISDDPAAVAHHMLTAVAVLVMGVLVALSSWALL